jgi:hypothetical protein
MREVASRLNKKGHPGPPTKANNQVEPSAAVPTKQMVLLNVYKDHGRKGAAV